jgi:hypothetical protein
MATAATSVRACNLLGPCHPIRYLVLVICAELVHLIIHCESTRCAKRDLLQCSKRLPIRSPRWR